ncbi:hypothetical protein [Desulfatirhabdium butyrativorans]|uniref:hypothetical protein n=1 Tax=Desulfatirhabdium butyrativorans TaxID=340467 RepID=UPI000421DA89|nr:hypothetical protein [Desulfatirhabdium butyrativorans]
MAKDVQEVLKAIKELGGSGGMPAIPGELMKRFHQWSESRLQAAVMAGIDAGQIEGVAYQGVGGQGTIEAWTNDGLLFDSGRGAKYDKGRYYVGFQLRNGAIPEKAVRPAQKEAPAKPTGRGGRRPGAGRPYADPIHRRELVGVRLPCWMAEWLKNQENAGRIVEAALVEKFSLQVPGQGKIESKNA